MEQQFQFAEKHPQQLVNDYALPNFGVPEFTEGETGEKDNFLPKAVLSAFLPLSKDGRRIPAIWLTRSENGNYVVNNDAIVYDHDEMPTNFYLPQGSLILGKLNDYYPERLDLALEPQWGIKLSDATQLSEEEARTLKHDKYEVNLIPKHDVQMPTAEIKKTSAETPPYMTYVFVAGVVIGAYALIKSFKN